MRVTSVINHGSGCGIDEGSAGYWGITDSGVLAGEEFGP